MKVWITRYALTKGIYQIEGKINERAQTYFQANERCQTNLQEVEFYTSYGKVDWHKTKEEAVVRAEEMRQKKIASLKKQIEKFEKMRFE
jgi:hypothetical protein